jgi:hypothetical protein
MASGISMVAVTILLLVSCIIVACCNEWFTYVIRPTYTFFKGVIHHNNLKIM